MNKTKLTKAHLLQMIADNDIAIKELETNIKVGSDVYKYENYKAIWLETTGDTAIFADALKKVKIDHWKKRLAIAKKANKKLNSYLIAILKEENKNAK